MHGDSLHENAMLRTHDRAADRSASARIFEHKPPPARRAQAHRPYADSRHQMDAAHDRRLPGSDEPCPGGVVMAKGGEKRARSEAEVSQPGRSGSSWQTSMCRASLGLSRSRRIGLEGCLSKSSFCISSNLRGRHPPTAIHASAGATGAPNSGGRGGKHTLQSGRPHMHLLDGAQS